uniref:I/LWEQ domain-containing protein n=1 Tax=Arcella intermedia TaxID=1963864 RepID=A0A6B2KWR4_9EUKA
MKMFHTSKHLTTKVMDLVAAARSLSSDKENLQKIRDFQNRREDVKATVGDLIHLLKKEEVLETKKLDEVKKKFNGVKEILRGQVGNIIEEAEKVKLSKVQLHFAKQEIQVNIQDLLESAQEMVTLDAAHKPKLEGAKALQKVVQNITKFLEDYTGKPATEVALKIMQCDVEAALMLMDTDGLTSDDMNAGIADVNRKSLEMARKITSTTAPYPGELVTTIAKILPRLPSSVQNQLKESLVQSKLLEFGIHALKTTASYTSSPVISDFFHTTTETVQIITMELEKKLTIPGFEIENAALSHVLQILKQLIDVAQNNTAASEMDVTPPESTEFNDLLERMMNNINNLKEGVDSRQMDVVSYNTKSLLYMKKEFKAITTSLSPYLDQKTKESLKAGNDEISEHIKELKSMVIVCAKNPKLLDIRNLKNPITKLENRAKKIVADIGPFISLPSYRSNVRKTLAPMVPLVNQLLFSIGEVQDRKLQQDLLSKTNELKSSIPKILLNLKTAVSEPYAISSHDELLKLTKRNIPQLRVVLRLTKEATSAISDTRKKKKLKKLVEEVKQSIPELEKSIQRCSVVLENSVVSSFHNVKSDLDTFTYLINEGLLVPVPGQTLEKGKLLLEGGNAVIKDRIEELIKVAKLGKFDMDILKQIASKMAAPIIGSRVFAVMSSSDEKKKEIIGVARQFFDSTLEVAKAARLLAIEPNNASLLESVEKAYKRFVSDIQILEDVVSDVTGIAEESKADIHFNGHLIDVSFDDAIHFSKRTSKDLKRSLEYLSHIVKTNPKFIVYSSLVVKKTFQHLLDLLKHTKKISNDDKLNRSIQNFINEVTPAFNNLLSNLKKVMDNGSPANLKELEASKDILIQGIDNFSVVLSEFDVPGAPFYRDDLGAVEVLPGPQSNLVSKFMDSIQEFVKLELELSKSLILNENEIEPPSLLDSQVLEEFLRGMENSNLISISHLTPVQRKLDSSKDTILGALQSDTKSEETPNTTSLAMEARTVLSEISRFVYASQPEEIITSGYEISIAAEKLIHSVKSTQSLQDLAVQVAKSLCDLLDVGKANRDPSTTKDLEYCSNNVSQSLYNLMEAAKVPHDDMILNLSAENFDDITQVELQKCLSKLNLAVKILNTKRASLPPNDPSQPDTNKAIFDGAQAILQASTKLVGAAASVQEERRKREGKGIRTKALYHTNSVWANGLVSAAKNVTGYAQQLIDVSSKISDQSLVENEVELITTARAVASATTHLVAASRVKSDPNSISQRNLDKISKSVQDSIDQLVSLVQKILETTNENSTDTMPLDYSTVAAKSTEFEHLVKIQQIEKQLENEKRKLMQLRKSRYLNDKVKLIEPSRPLVETKPAPVPTPAPVPKDTLGKVPVPSHSYPTFSPLPPPNRSPSPVPASPVRASGESHRTRRSSFKSHPESKLMPQPLPIPQERDNNEEERKTSKTARDIIKSPRDLIKKSNRRSGHLSRSKLITKEDD